MSVEKVGVGVYNILTSQDFRARFLLKRDYFCLQKGYY